MHLDYDSTLVVIENMEKVIKLIGDKKKEAYFAIDITRKPGESFSPLLSLVEFCYLISDLSRTSPPTCHRNCTFV